MALQAEVFGGTSAALEAAIWLQSVRWTFPDSSDRSPITSHHDNETGTTEQPRRATRHVTTGPHGGSVVSRQHKCPGWDSNPHGVTSEGV